MQLINVKNFAKYLFPVEDYFKFYFDRIDELYEQKYEKMLENGDIELYEEKIKKVSIDEDVLKYLF